MVKIAWKVINGYGPYAYLQESYKDQGKVKSKHLAYLGAAGTNGLVPGKMLTVEAVEDFPGGRVMVPSVGDDTLDALKPKPMAKVQLMHEKIGEGLSKQQVLELLESQPGKKAAPKSPVLAPPVAPVANVPQVPLKVTNVALDANGKPLITAESIKKLEEAAAKGDMPGLRKIMYGLADMQKTEPEKWAINYATQDLVNKYNLNQGSFQVVTVNKPPNGVAYPKPEDVVSKPLDTATAAPETAPTEAAPAPTAPTDDKPIQLDIIPTGGEEGLPIISTSDVKTLEKLANDGHVWNLSTTVMGLAQKQKTKADQAAVEKAGQELLDKLSAKQGKAVAVAVAPPPPAPTPPAPTPATVPQQSPLKVTEIAKDANGQPLITAKSIKTLEEYAEKGDMNQVVFAATGLGDQQKTEAKKWAIYYAAQDLVHKISANKGYTAVSPIPPPPMGVAYPKPEDVASKPLEEKPVQFDKTSTGKVKGVPFLSLTAINVLESIASKGDVDKLTDMLMGSVNAQTDEKKKLAVKKAGKDLLEKAYAHQGKPQKVNSDTLAVESKAATPEPPATAADKPIKLESVPDGLDASEVKYLELLANYGDVPAFDSAVDQLKAKKPNDWVAIAEASNNLLNQVYAKQDLKSAPQPIIQGLPTPDPDSPIKLENVPGVLKPSDVKKLEKMANEGVAYKLMSAAMGLAQKQNTKSDQAAVKKAGQELLNKLYAKQSASKVEAVTPPEPDDAGSKPDAAVAAAPEPLTPTPAPAPAPTDETPIQLDAIPYGGPKDAPLITMANVEKLEIAANQGEDQLSKTIADLAQEQTTDSKQHHILYAGKLLLEKLYAKQGNPKTVYIDALAAASKVGPKPATQAAPAPTDETPIQLDAIPTMGKGKTPLITIPNVKKLEKLANEGDAKKLTETVIELAQKQLPNELKQFHTLQAGQELLEKLYAKQGNPQTVYLDDLLAASKVAPKSSISPAPPVGPVWVQVGPQAGSTPGGLFEDKEGVKHYIKCPPTLDHVNNELTAFDLYQAVGLNVPETDMTVHDGKYCVTSKIIDGLSESGTNPKDLKGTQEGFVADAWLANWDSVGVGTTKYDNILGLNGEAYRIDAGGALSYHGTGGPKGDKFGNEVTELDGMRDPKVNPVAATVYGDMTLEQIKASAEPVLALESDEIENIVKLYQGSNPQSQAMIDKLLARQKYIGEWIEKKELGQKLTSVLSGKANAKAPAEQPAAVTVAPNNVKVQVGDIPKDNKGKALIIPMNVKKLEAAAKKGEPELQKACDDIIAKMLSPAKKAAVQNVCADLKGQLQGIPMVEGDGGSGQSEAVAQVDAGTVTLPKQSTPTPKVVTKEVEAVKNEAKNYNKDLEQVSGKKGSNEGGLFKDKKLDTLHYLKWPNGDVRAKIEGLSAMLYAYSETPVPNVRVVNFQDKPAVMSDWIEDAQPMTVAEMKKHKDVLNGFVADAWLSNWDAVGLNADNIVKGPGNKAYRIDLGGSMLFRAQGKPKDFPAEVMELETLVDPSVNPQAASVFGEITPEHLKEGATRLQNIDDSLIDQAVDHANLPKTSEDYPASVYGEDAKDLPRFLKTRLKERRNHLVMEILKKAEAQAVTAADVAKTSDLKKASITAIVGKTPGFKASTPSTAAKWAVLNTVMGHELGGKTHAKEPSATLKNHYSSWKGTTAGPQGAALRWAAGELHGTGRQEISRLQKYHDFEFGKSKSKSKSKATKSTNVQHVENLSTTPHGKNLVDGIRVADKHNSAVFQLQHPSKKTLTLYRGWREDQLKYLQLNNAKVGDVLDLKDPPLYSWSLYPSIGKNFGHGGIVTKAQVPIESIVLSDIVNSTGSFSNENEVLFKGVDKVKMEVTHTT